MKKTYADVLKMLEAPTTNGVFVAVYWPDNNYCWMPVDKTKYIQYLRDITNRIQNFPCHVEYDVTGYVFFFIPD